MTEPLVFREVHPLERRVFTVKPTVTILDYLWSGRNSWLKHDNECICEFEKLSSEYIENALEVKTWAEIVVVNEMPTMQMIRMAMDDWNELCGPAAESRQLQELLDLHMEEVSKIMALQATKERQGSE